MMRHLAPLLLLPLAACADPAKDPAEPSPYDRPDRSGCAYEVAYDVGADGTDDWTQSTVYTDGERVSEYRYERPADGAVRTMSYTYDGNGCVRTYTFEDVSEADGTSTSVSATQTCDEHGNPVEAVYTQDFTGSSSVWTYTYTNVYDGDLLVEQSVAISTDDGTTVTRRPDRTTYEYDGEGRVVLETGYAEDAWYSTTERTWHAEDQPDTFHYETAAVTLDASWTYDAHDRQIATTSVEEEEGEVVSLATTSTWSDTHYRLTAATSDDGMDGEDDATSTYTCEGDWPWSCAVEVDGRSAAGLEDGTVDGEVDHRWRFDWSCE